MMQTGQQRQEPAKLDISGEIVVNHLEKLKFRIANTGIRFQPYVLEMHFFDRKDQSWVEERLDSGLYFCNGKIVDRAPANTHTSAKELQEAYAGPLWAFLVSRVDAPAKEALKAIAGFFEGEEGILRRQSGIVRDDL